MEELIPITLTLDHIITYIQDYTNTYISYVINLLNQVSERHNNSPDD